MQLDHDTMARSAPLFKASRAGHAMRTLTCLVLLWLLAGCVSLSRYAVTLLPTECPLPVPEELEEGHTIRCGFLQLPQDRAQPDGRQVRIPYAHIRAESAHPRPDPLVYIVGGPGGSALAEFTEIYGWFRMLRRDRDLILYDQRGTLLAEPTLECVFDLPAPTAAEIDAVNARVPNYLRPIDANDVMIARCADDLHAQGIDLAHYDTVTHAHDLLDLVRALGYQEFNLYGTSYGTRIALEVMRLSPPTLRAVVLDSVYPPTVDAYETPHMLIALEALNYAFVACARDEACAAAYPNLTTRFDQVVRQLNEVPVALPLSWQATFSGDDLRQLLLTRLDGALLPYVPRLIDELARQESTLLLGVLQGDVPPPAVPRAAPFAAADEARVTDFVLALNGALLVQQAHLDDAALREWRQLAARNADRARLQRFVERYLPATTAQSLIDQLAQLTEIDLALAFAELRSIPLYPLTRGANLAVQCRDEQPFNDYEVAVTAHQAHGIPEALVADEMVRLRHHWAQCALFPTGVAAVNQTEAVTSHVPVLIFQGMLDTITPPSWAAEARRTLPNAHYFEFPSQGHVVIQQTFGGSANCLVQLARAFLDAPDATPAATCIGRTYAIPWRLPDAEVD